MSKTLVTVLTAVVMLLGLAGVVLPALPGLALIWLAALGYGPLAGWGASGPWLFGLITLLGLAGLGSELWVTSAGARVAGTSGWSVLAGIVLGLIGLLFFSPIGAVIGLTLGILGAEYLPVKELAQGAQRRRRHARRLRSLLWGQAALGDGHDRRLGGLGLDRIDPCHRLRRKGADSKVRFNCEERGQPASAAPEFAALGPIRGQSRAAKRGAVPTVRHFGTAPSLGCQRSPLRLPYGSRCARTSATISSTGTYITPRFSGDP